MSSKKPLAKPVSTQKTDLAALRKASKLPLANPDKQEEEKLLSDVAAEEAQDTPVQLAAAPSTVVSDASPAGAHSVGDAHAAHAAQPAAQASGMGALSSNWLLGAAGFGLVAAAASGGGGGGSSPAATPTPSQQGTAIDGYVVGADVYLDTNNNHQLDAGDTKVGTTGKGGSFSVSNPNKLDVFVKGGFNDSNQNGTKDAGELDNTVVLKATGGTSGNFIVSPLTTLVQELLRQSPQTTQKAAESTIKAALGLDQAIDLTTFDPLAAGNTANALAAYKAAVQVATALDIAADEQAFLQALVSKLTANTTPGASGILVSSITAAFTGSTDNNVTSTELLNKLELIGSATSIGNITESQAQVNNDKEVTKPVFTLNSDTGSSQTDNITSDKVVKVTLAADVASWEYSLKGGEWTKGTGTSFNLADNATYATGEIKVRQTDKAGNVSEVANNAVAITVDNAVSQPTFALNDDTGIPDDLITNDNVVNVTLAQDVASWEYSLKGGEWTKGTGTSFNLADNATYAAGEIKVRQTDKAGNVSEVANNAVAITVDNAVSQPTFALNDDTGIPDDLITNNNVVNVTLAQDVASWEYSLKGGEWTKGTGTSFNLEDNTSYAVGDIRVRQTDKAGNVSEAASNTLRIIEDSLVEAPTVALLNDTGASTSDKVTSSATLNVTTTEPGGVVEYTLDGGKNWLSQLDYAAAVANDGNYTVAVRQTDMAGNVSAASTPLAFTLSKAVPAAAISGVQFLERMELGAQDAEYVLKVEGSNMRSLLTGSAVTGDVTAQLDFSKLSWKLDGSNTVSLANGIEKAEVISDTEMWLHLTVAQYQALVASGALLDSVDRVSDSLVIDSGFLVSASGVANTAHYTESALGSVYQLELNGTPNTPPLVYASQIELSGSGTFASDNTQTPTLDIKVSGSGTVEVSVAADQANELIFTAQQTGGSIILNLAALTVGGESGLVSNSGTGELNVYLEQNVNQVAMEGSMTIYQVGEGGNITLGAGSQHIAVYEDHATDLNLSGFESGVDKVVLDVNFLNAQFGGTVFFDGDLLSNKPMMGLNQEFFSYDANTGILTLDADNEPQTTNITLLQFEAGTQLQTSDFLVAKIV